MTEMVAMRFVKRWHVYNEGEVAGFLPERAEELEVSGIAVKANGSSAVPEAPVAPPSAPSPTKADDSGAAPAVVTSIAQAVKQG